MRFELRELARKIVKKAINAMLNEKADQLVAESLYECTDERELTTAVESDHAWPFCEVPLRRHSTQFPDMAAWKVARGSALHRHPPQAREVGGVQHPHPRSKSKES